MKRIDKEIRNSFKNFTEFTGIHDGKIKRENEGLKPTDLMLMERLHRNEIKRKTSRKKPV